SGTLMRSDLVLVNETQIGGRYEIAAQATNDISASVHVAWDRSKGPSRGNLYLVYTDQADSAGTTHVKFRVSTDGGHTWGDGIHVDDATNTYSLTVDDADTANSPFNPSIALNQSNGDVAVEWYDTRTNPNLLNTSVRVAVYDPRSLSFSKS